jgi:insulysin
VVTPQDVEALGKEILSRLYVETLIHGNTSPAGAKEIQDMVEKVLKARALAEGEKENPRTLILPPCELY